MFAFAPELLDKLQSLEPGAWRGIVFRHMFAHYPPTFENTRGARWNPAGTAALYTSLDRETSLAEAEYSISLQPLPPETRRTIYRIEVKLNNVLDLRAEEVLAVLGLTSAERTGIELSMCQEIGGAVAWLGHDGLLVPSARHKNGSNLVIYPTSQASDTEFEVLDSEEILASGGKRPLL